MTTQYLTPSSVKANQIKKNKKTEDHWSCIAHLISCFILSDLGQRSMNDLDSDTSKLSPSTHLVNCLYPPAFMPRGIYFLSFRLSVHQFVYSFIVQLR